MARMCSLARFFSGLVRAGDWWCPAELPRRRLLFCVDSGGYSPSRVWLLLLVRCSLRGLSSIPAPDVLRLVSEGRRGVDSLRVPDCEERRWAEWRESRCDSRRGDTGSGLGLEDMAGRVWRTESSPHSSNWLCVLYSQWAGKQSPLVYCVASKNPWQLPCSKVHTRTQSECGQTRVPQIKLKAKRK